ncbi:MAG: hypothetical protein M3328_12630 [Chloroflexota bacterium]|nr:hypothetical protein [Chloroflexota bacterium]
MVERLSVCDTWSFSLEIARQFASCLDYGRYGYVISVKPFATLVATLRMAPGVAQGTRALSAFTIVDDAKRLWSQL